MPGETSLAALAFRLRETTEGTPEREALLERIATEIREGRYEVDTDILADKLLASKLLCPDSDTNQK